MSRLELRVADVISEVDGLRIAQITDPHLGDFCTVERMQEFCMEIIKADPDLVLLTGDFYTPQGSKPGDLRRAFSPLKKIASKCFACTGNHDCESREVLEMTILELDDNGILLLRDQAIDLNIGGKADRLRNLDV